MTEISTSLGENKHIRAQFCRESLFTLEECQKILNYKNIYGLSEAELFQTLSDNPYQDKDMRDTKVTVLRAYEPEHAWIVKRMMDCVNIINSMYYKFYLSNISDLQILEYSENGHFDWHSDLGSGPMSSSRKLSIIVFLSDKSEYQGGNLIWNPSRPTDHGFSRNLGSFIIFPSFLEHKVTPLTKGKRNTLVAWIHGKPFK